MASERRSRRNPDRPPTHPGAFLREIVLPEIGLSKSDVADRLGVSRQHLYDILDERRAVTPTTALRFGKLFGNGPRLWLNMQRTWDLWHAERELADELEAMAPIDADDEEAPRSRTIRVRSSALKTNAAAIAARIKRAGEVVTRRRVVAVKASRATAKKSRPSGKTR